MPRNYRPILGPFGESVSDYDGGDDRYWENDSDGDDSEEDSVDGSVPDDSSERDWDSYDDSSEDDSDGEASPVAKKQKQ